MADAPYVLYGHPESRSKLVEHVLVELGVDCDHQTIDFKHGGHRMPAFLAINPAGWIPALRMPDGRVLTETAAINLTLAEHHHCADGTSLVPALPDPLRAEFFALLFHITGMLEPALKRLWYPTRYAGGLANEGAVVVDAKRDISPRSISSKISSLGAGLTYLVTAFLWSTSRLRTGSAALPTCPRRPPCATSAPAPTVFMRARHCSALPETLRA